MCSSVTSRGVPYERKNGSNQFSAKWPTEFDRRNVTSQPVFATRWSRRRAPRESHGQEQLRLVSIPIIYHDCHLTSCRHCCSMSAFLLCGETMAIHWPAKLIYHRCSLRCTVLAASAAWLMQFATRCELAKQRGNAMLKRSSCPETGELPSRPSCILFDLSRTLPVRMWPAAWYRVILFVWSCV